jgi:hypothetical protein
MTSESSNAEFDPQSAIDAAIGAMLKMPTKEVERLNFVPDFVGLRAHVSYSDLCQEIERLEALQSAARSLLRAYWELKDAFPEAIERLDGPRRIDARAGLSASNLIKLGGVAKFADYAAYELLVETGTELETLTAEKRAYGRKNNNPKAYLIADLLARLYVRVKLKRPTVGTADGGHPSTEYTLALVAIYKALGMSVKQARGPATAARDGISDDEVEAAKAAHKGKQMTFADAVAWAARNARASG